MIPPLREKHKRRRRRRMDVLFFFSSRLYCYYFTLSWSNGSLMESQTSRKPIGGALKPLWHSKFLYIYLNPQNQKRGSAKTLCICTVHPARTPQRYIRRGAAGAISGRTAVRSRSQSLPYMGGWMGESRQPGQDAGDGDGGFFFKVYIPWTQSRLYSQ